MPIPPLLIATLFSIGRRQFLLSCPTALEHGIVPTALGIQPGHRNLMICGPCKKKETCLQVVPSHSYHPLTDSQYQLQQTILHESPEHGNVIHYGVPAFANFQCHMIACIVCVSQWKKVFFHPHDIFPEFSPKAQLSWSKNVCEEHHDPWQIVLGSKTQFIVCS